MTIRQALIDTGIFTETDSRDLFLEHPEDESTNIRVTFEFDSFGDLRHVSAHLINRPLHKAVAENRRALGLPPQGS